MNIKVTAFTESKKFSHTMAAHANLCPFAELFLTHAESFVSDFRILGLTLTHREGGNRKRNKQSRDEDQKSIETVFLIEANTVSIDF